MAADMIEVDLGPNSSGSRTRRALRSRSIVWLGGIQLDPWVLACGIVVLGSLGTAAYLAVASTRQVSVLEVAVEVALRDSAQSAAGTQLLLQAHDRLDLISARISTIEDVDATRYRWPHILDEIAAALPEGAWITGIADVASDGPGIRFQVEGQALDNFALTRFWNALETSFFIRNVQLISTEHLLRPVSDDDGGPSTSYQFVLGAEYEDPPDEIVEFVRTERGAP